MNIKRCWKIVLLSLVSIMLTKALLAQAPTDSTFKATTDTTFKAPSDTTFKTSADSTAISSDSLSSIPKLSEKERKRMVRDSIRAVKDSIRLSTPRIMETCALPDSLYYKKIIAWNTDTYFNKLNRVKVDTTYNDWYTEYPFFKEDVNATYLGVVGSATQNFDYFKRRDFDIAPFYAPYLSYSYTPETLTLYNTKTPHTVLAYWGTLFSYKDKEESSAKFLHTQNITPKLNLMLEYHMFGGKGLLTNEATNNRTFTLAANYLGENYVANGGFISNNIRRKENGGVFNSKEVTDTTLDAKTIAVNLSSASNKISKKTFFLSHSLGIPIKFRHKVDTLIGADSLLMDPMVDPSVGPPLDSTDVDSEHSSMRGFPATHATSVPTSAPISAGSLTSISTTGSTATSSVQPQDSLSAGEGTMAYFGHYAEYSVFSKFYNDQIGESDTRGRSFYFDRFYINPTTSADSLRVTDFTNRLYVRLQPWSNDAIVSQIEGGVGFQHLNYFSFQPNSFLTKSSNVSLNNTYVYASANGMFRKYFSWEGFGKYTLLGYNATDMELNAAATFSFYPFANKSEGIDLTARFSTSAKRPDYYSDNLYFNHYKWSNDFHKVSKTKIEGDLNIPKWKLSAHFGYALIGNNIYYDTTGVIRQNDKITNVISGYIQKNFKFGIVHLDNQALIQFSSDQATLPLPLLALHLRYYIEFDVVKNAMRAQIGADGTFTTAYYAPAYSPALGQFHNQELELVGNTPYIDVFANIQWKTVSIFLKFTNAADGWPTGDYFSAYHYIKPKRAFKIGIFWPFFVK